MLAREKERKYEKEREREREGFKNIPKTMRERTFPKTIKDTEIPSKDKMSDS